MKVAYHVEDGRVGYTILCPACGTAHFFSHEWTFNWDLESPTFKPSLFIGPRPDRSVCHMEVKDGMIYFCNDSTHHLRGQTVPLEDVPWD